MTQGAENDLLDITPIQETTPVQYIRDNEPLVDLNSNILTVDDKAILARDAASTSIANLFAHVGASGSAHANATSGGAGFMSAADKFKLNNIQEGAQVNTMSPADSIELTNRKETALHRHPNATPSASGYMEFADKVKLDGVELAAKVNRISDVDRDTLTLGGNADSLHVHGFSQTVETFTALVHAGVDHSLIPGTQANAVFDTTDSYFEGTQSGAATVFIHTYPDTVQSYAAGMAHISTGLVLGDTWTITDISISTVTNPGDTVTISYGPGPQLSAWQGAYV
jgi:hypothetical protein